MANFNCPFTGGSHSLPHQLTITSHSNTQITSATHNSIVSALANGWLTHNFKLWHRVCTRGTIGCTKHNYGGFAALLLANHRQYSLILMQLNHSS